MFYKNNKWYRCHQLKTSGKCYSNGFFNNTMNMKLTNNDLAHNISHIVDIKKLSGIEKYLYEY